MLLDFPWLKLWGSILSILFLYADIHYKEVKESEREREREREIKFQWKRPRRYEKKFPWRHCPRSHDCFDLQTTFASENASTPDRTACVHCCYPRQFSLGLVTLSSCVFSVSMFRLFTQGLAPAWKKILILVHFFSVIIYILLPFVKLTFIISVNSCKEEHPDWCLHQG